ncbi:MAG: RNA-binding protein [Lachnospirales bacterium]
MKISKTMDKVNLTIMKNIKTVTEFLSPMELSDVLKEVLYEKVKYKIYGGYEDSERNKIAFSSEFEEIYNWDFSICILQIKYNKKFYKELKHPDVLGSVLGLGISRDLIGDILIGEDIYIFVDEKISDYILMSLEYVGRTKVWCERIEEISYKKKECEVINFGVNSLRVDVVIAAIFNLSRSVAKELIDKEKVFLNYNVVNSVSKVLNEKDVASVRGYGKFQFLEETGLSKKGKIRIDVKMY